MSSPDQAVRPANPNPAGDREKILEYVAQTDARGENFVKLFEGPWILASGRAREETEELSYAAALIPRGRMASALERSDWELATNHGMPGFVTYSDGGHERTQYYRFGDEDAIEPLVLHRFFHGMRPSSMELCEEFRLFHNLHYEEASREFVRFADNGDAEPVARIGHDRVLIRRRELMQFAAAKDMGLALFVDRFRYGFVSPPLKPEEAIEEEIATEKSTYSFHRSDARYIGHAGRNVFSRLLGKLLIVPGPGWNDPPAEHFEDFIIGVDDRGDDRLHSCDPDRLANYFGANPGAPHYLTPVFFRRDVLQKYYADSSKYVVDDSHVKCCGMWSLRLDNNHPRYVIVYLGDLGTYLPEKERPYWKSFNVRPDGRMSSTYYRRSILAEWADPVAEDHVFRDAYDELRREWAGAFSWPLFRELAEGDQHVGQGVHVPVSNSLKEFEEQVMALTKLMVDYLNEVAIAAQLEEVPKDAKGLAKLELFLQASGSSGADEVVRFLRDLQDLRSTGAAHAKGKKYEAAKKRFGVDDRPYPETFRLMLRQAIAALDEFASLARIKKGENPPSPA